MRARLHRFAGLDAFRVVWLGQSASALGSGLTGFALGVWAYQQTGSAARFATIAACSVLPGLLLSPFAGTLVDRWNLRTALIVGHSGALFGALLLALLLAGDRLEVWHLYLITAGTSVTSALQWPAFTAATTRFVPPDRLGRASGTAQLGDAAAQMLSPALGGVLLGLVGLKGVVLVELLGAVLALGAFASCVFPHRPAARDAPRSMRRETAAGWAYVAARPGLLGLLALSCILNGAVSFLEVLSAPIVLATSSGAMLGFVRSAAGAGMVAGSVLMSRWGGPGDRVLGIVVFQTLLGGWLVGMGLTTSPGWMASTAFCGLFCIPLVNGCSQTLWQTKVDLALQGRVFALRRLSGFFRPLGHLAAGAVADRVLEPYVRGGGLGWLVGSAPGRGSALLLVAMGTATVITTLLAYAYRPLREAQRALPDAVGLAPGGSPA